MTTNIDPNYPDLSTETDADRSAYTPGLTVRDLPDCLLLVPEVTKRGGLHYIRLSESVVETSGKAIEVDMETRKIIDDPAEHSEATSLVSRWKYKLRGLGRHVPGGIVVRRERKADVEAIVAEGRAEFAEFNARAMTCRVGFTAWVHDISGSNAANLQSLLDELGDMLAELEGAVEAMSPKGIRDVLKRSKGFVELLPGEVAERLATAQAQAQAKAEELSRAEKKIARIDAKLAEELGTDSPEDYTARIDALLAGPLTGELAQRVARLSRLVEDKQSTADSLEVARRTVDTSAIRLARFAIIGEARPSSDDGALGAAQAAARFGALGAEGIGEGGKAPAGSESEDRDADSDAAPQAEAEGSAPRTEAQDSDASAAPERKVLSKAAAVRFGGLAL